MWMPLLVLTSISLSSAVSTSQTTPSSADTLPSSAEGAPQAGPAVAAPASSSKPDASSPPAAEAAPPADGTSSPTPEPSKIGTEGQPAGTATSPPLPSATAVSDAVAAENREKTLAAAERISIAILALDGNKAAQDDAPGVASLLASNLAESPMLKVITQAEIVAVLGVERQRALMAGGDCSTDSCMTELAGALASRYLVAGRLDRYGEKYILTTTVFDSKSANSLAKPRAEVPEQEELPEAAASIGQQIRLALGDAPQASSIQRHRFSVALKIGSGFFASVANLAPSGDLELGYRFADEWVGAIQVGFKTVFSSDGRDSVGFVPSMIGIRKLHFVQDSFQPYWGFGLGIQFAFGQLGIFTNTGPLPSVYAVGGFQYMFSTRFGVLLEGRTNLAQAALGLIESEARSNGFNIELTAGAQLQF